MLSAVTTLANISNANPVFNKYWYFGVPKILDIFLNSLKNQAIDAQVCSLTKICSRDRKFRFSK